MAGCTFESANPRYIAVDMPPSADVTALYELLERGKEQGVWSLKRAITQESSSRADSQN
jgi:Domain of unknown function (DUF4265)